MVGGTFSNLKHESNRRAFVVTTALRTIQPIQQEPFCVKDLRLETDCSFNSTKHALLLNIHESMARQNRILQPAHQS
jgi:hypothetical protein